MDTQKLKMITTPGMLKKYCQDHRDDVFPHKFSGFQPSSLFGVAKKVQLVQVHRGERTMKKVKGSLMVDYNTSTVMRIDILGISLGIYTMLSAV